LRFQVTHFAKQLLGITKSKIVDDRTGKEVEVESPNLYKTSLRGKVQLPDGQPVLMLLHYRPPGKENEKRVWLLVARPIIWIEAEAEERRKGGEEFTPKSVWTTEVEKVEKPKEPAPLPSSDDVNQILQAVVNDLLTNPDLKATREFYGAGKAKTFA